MTGGDLPAFAEQLKARGFHARVGGVKDGPTGIQIGAEFFPLWELNHPQNAAMLVYCDFDGIRDRRGPNWKISEPEEALGPGHAK